jgi:hypothetical protein
VTDTDKQEKRLPLTMNPPCARCKKIVYPVEKLSCLDKVKKLGMALAGLAVF